MGVIDKAKVFVGSNLVRFGIRLLGVKPDKSEFSLVDDGDVEETSPMSMPRVELSDVARDMLVNGMQTYVAKVEKTDAPLVGSVAERMNRAKREMGR